MGTLVNLLTVLVGSALGLAFGSRLPQRLSETVLHGVAAFTLTIGLDMAFETRGSAQAIAVLLALAAGAATGEALQLEQRLEALAARLERSFAALVSTGPSPEGSASPARAGERGSNFVRGFVAASLLFCVGPLTLLGSLQDGLSGDATLLYTKAVLDGLSSIALAATLGAGVAFAALTILVYQGGLTLLAGLLRGGVAPETLALTTAAGGLMIVALGLNLFGVTHVRVANLLPGLLYAGLAAHLLD